MGPTEGAKWIPTQDNVKHINVDLTPKKERRDGRCEDPDEDMEAEPEPKVPRTRVVTNMSDWNISNKYTMMLLPHKTKRNVNWCCNN